MPGLQDTRRGILQTQINRCTSNVTPSTRFRGYDDLFAAMKLPPQFGLGALQSVALRFRQRLAGAVDIKGQHRERRAIGACLAARTSFRRALERCRDFLRVGLFEDAVFQVERVAFLRYSLRPALWRRLLLRR